MTTTLTVREQSVLLFVNEMLDFQKQYSILHSLHRGGTAHGGTAYSNGDYMKFDLNERYVGW